MQTPVVALCEQFDIAAYLGAVLTARHPQFRVLRPEEVEAPEAIRHALVFRPGPDALAPYPNLRLLCLGAAGADGILSHPGLTPQMTVVRTEIAEQGLMMAGFAAHYVTGWQRRMWDYPGLQAARDWTSVNMTAPCEFPVGVLGFGAIGARVAEVLSTMGYPVTALARTPRDAGDTQVVTGAEGLSRIARSSKVVINILPLTPQTARILDAGFFAQMADDAMLVQIGRGGHLVEDDLLAALDRGRPAYAAMDVFDTEPLPADSPFWTHPRVMLTPHVASLAPRAEIADWLAKAIGQFDRGERPQGLVDVARGY